MQPKMCHSGFSTEVGKIVTTKWKVEPLPTQWFYFHSFPQTLGIMHMGSECQRLDEAKLHALM